MPRRRFNYTKRHKLTAAEAAIRLLPRPTSDAGRPTAAQTFDVDFELPDHLPPNGRVFVEAYRSAPAARMRFDFGTVGSITVPADLNLYDFAADPRQPLFNIKITDVQERPGCLIALRSQIAPTDPDEKPENRQGVLLTKWVENNLLVWSLDYGDPRSPTLVIDQKADPYHELPRSRHFMALVYPEILRRVFTHLLDKNSEGFDDEDGWPAQWMRLPEESFGFTSPPPELDAEEGEKDEWIDDFVRHAADHHKLCESLAPKGDNPS